MSRLLWFSLGTLAVTGGAVAGASYVFRRQQGAADGEDSDVPPAGEPSPDTPIPAPKPTSLTPIAWDRGLALPTAAEVKGDLTRNWGRTPLDLRPLLLLAEEASKISGAARILAIIGYRCYRRSGSA